MPLSHRSPDRASHRREIRLVAGSRRHLAQETCACRYPAISGQARHKKGNRYVAAVAGETSVAAGKTGTREGARYWRLSRRRGKSKAVVATGNTQLRVLHVLLSHPGMRYEDLGADYYERRRETARQVSRHVGKLGALGYRVTLSRLPDEEGGPQAA